MNKKIVVEYNDGNGSGWKTVRDHGCRFWNADSAESALEYAKCTLADKIQRIARNKALKEASESRNYSLADNYPDGQASYIEVNGYQWRVSKFDEGGEAQ